MSFLPHAVLALVCCLAAYSTIPKDNIFFSFLISQQSRLEMSSSESVYSVSFYQFRLGARKKKGKKFPFSSPSFLSPSPFAFILCAVFFSCICAPWNIKIADCMPNEINSLTHNPHKAKTYSFGKQTNNFANLFGHLYLSMRIYKSLTIIDYSLYLFVFLALVQVPSTSAAFCLFLTASWHEKYCAYGYLMPFWFRGPIGFCGVGEQWTNDDEREIYRSVW